MSDETTPGIPDPEGDYFARITFGRKANAAKGETEDKIYLDFQYPNLPYGGMVGVQKLLAEGALQDLVAMGEFVSESLGHPVMGAEEIKTELEKLKKERGKGQTNAPAKPAPKRR
jgi:hypothetical protein